MYHRVCTKKQKATVQKDGYIGKNPKDGMIQVINAGALNSSSGTSKLHHKLLLQRSFANKSPAAKLLVSQCY